MFEAAADAPLDGDLIDLRAKLADPKQPPLEGGFENVADFVLGEPNNAVVCAGAPFELAMAVGEKVPYHLEIVQPKAPLVRSGTMNLKVLVHREAGFDAPLTVQFPFNPRVSGRRVRSRSKKGANKACPLTRMPARQSASGRSW